MATESGEAMKPVESIEPECGCHGGRAEPEDEIATEAMVGQARISGRMEPVIASTTASSTAADFDTALRAALAVTGHALVLGDPLRAGTFAVHTWGPAMSRVVPLSIELDATNVAALLVNGGDRVYLRANPIASTPSDRLRWVHVPGIAAFLALPAAQQTSQRREWIRRIRAAGVVNPATSTAFTEAELGALSAPILRLLLASHAGAAFSVGAHARGGVVHGVTLPLLRTPISEPHVYLRVISMREGKMESINAWDLGAGISLGPIQINAQRGAVFRFLWDVWQQDRTVFEQTIGSAPTWAMRDAGGVPELSVQVGTAAQWLRGGADDPNVTRNIRWFHSGDPTSATIDVAHRRALAARCVRLVAWPHAQALLEDTTAWWLKPGLDQIHRPANGIPALSATAPDRDTFILKALLLSTYVRFSGCLAPLLTALRRWPTVSQKLAHWRDALAAMTGACSATGTQEQRDRNALLLRRLGHQERDAAGVFAELQALLGRQQTRSEALAITETIDTVHAEMADNAPLATRCGFFGPNVQRSTQEVRAAVVSAANAEWTRWHTSAGAPRTESEVGLFGDLVRYYLSAISAIRPDTLTAIQAVAVAATTSYGSLPTAGTNAATVASEAARVRGVLLAGAPNAASPANLATLVEQALTHARQAHLDTGAHSAWSSVWVSHCVRKAAIDLGLEAMIQGNHSGRDELLRVSGAHRVYALEAHRRRVGPSRRDGTYHAFAPTSRAPAVGDIIVQDRQANTVAQVLSYADIAVLAQGRKTHGDIVVEVAAGHVVTIGGNLGQGVRKRRFPLDANGRLVVASNQLYTQEDSAGALAAVPATTTAALASTSTRRIFALLSPIEVCAAIPGQPFAGGVLV